MTHPYYHAESSVLAFGGITKDYLKIHTWLDATKVFFCDCRHRALRHNLESIPIAEELFGKNITASDDQIVAVNAIVEQHIREDCGGLLPTLADWLQEIKLPFPIANIPVEQLSVSCADIYGGKASDYRRIHDWFDETRKYLDDLRHYALRHHTVGIFEAEAIFGQTIINSNNTQIPVRYIGEFHVRKRCCGRIPTLADWLRAMVRRAWMNRPTKVYL